MSKLYTIARISIEGKNYELIVKPETALEYREGKPIGLSNVLVTETVFSDANKGLKVSEKDLQATFATTDIQKIAEMILKKGTLQLTADQRRRMIEEKKRQIVTLISRQAVDPRTKLPHPPTRIEQALEQAHFAVDPFGDVEAQANEAIKALRSLLPISVEKISVKVRIPSQYIGKVYGTVKSFGTIKNESWQADGSWTAIIEMIAGLYGSFIEKLGDLTKGNAEGEILK